MAITLNPDGQIIDMQLILILKKKWYAPIGIKIMQLKFDIIEALDNGQSTSSSYQAVSNMNKSITSKKQVI